MHDIIIHIQNAREKALRENIRVNTVIIDKYVAKVNGFDFLAIDGTINSVPTMLLGLKVEYVENLSDVLGIETNFALYTKKEPINHQLEQFSTDELLEELRRRLCKNE